jgi:hypothetical protein
MMFRDHLSNDSRLLRFYDYWAELRGSTRALPLRRDFDPAVLKDLLPNIAIVEPAGQRFFIRLVGSAIVDRVGSDATGMFLDAHASGAYLEFMQKVYRTICGVRRPVLSQTLYGVGRWSTTRFRRLSVPFTKDGVDVAQIVSLVLFYWQEGTEPLIVISQDPQVPIQNQIEAIGDFGELDARN